MRTIVLTILIIISSIQCSFAYFWSTEDTHAHIVIDYNNGSVISAYRENEKMYPASLTKLMTLYILFGKLKNHEISFEQKFLVSKDASRQEPTKLGLPAGSYIKVKDAIFAVIVKSANDMAYAIAENVAGSKDDFVVLMNQQARLLGMNHTHFVNPNGLPNTDQYTTASDLALLTRALMIHYNSYYTLFSTPNFKWNNVNYRSTNHLLDYEGVDGIKTGYTRASGYNLITSAYKNNTRVIAVVLGFKSWVSRDNYMKQIISDDIPLASENRKYLVQVTYKPNDLEGFHPDNQDISSLYVANSNYTTPISSSKDDNSNDYNILKSEYDLTSNYSIKNDPYIQKINAYQNQNNVVISPDIKYGNKFVKTLYDPKKYVKGSYSIQLGSFSTYTKAINVVLNAAKIKDLKFLLIKKRATITKNKDFYTAKYNHLSKENAQYACSRIKNLKVSECLIVSPKKKTKHH